MSGCVNHGLPIPAGMAGNPKTHIFQDQILLLGELFFLILSLLLRGSILEASLSALVITQQ